MSDVLPRTTEQPGPSGEPRPLDLAAALAPRFADRAAHHDVAGSFPAADIDDLRAAGLLGLLVPTHLGGAGASFADYADVAIELGSGSGATALIFNMHASVTGALAQLPEDLLRRWGVSDGFFAARERVLSDAAAGSLYAVAMSERGAGSRLSRVSTEYRAVPGGYRITGSKTFVSGAGHADAYLLAARNAVAAEPTVSHFLVPGGDGVTVEHTWDAMGMRATRSDDLHVDVEVPEEALLGGIEGMALVIAEAMPQWLVASYAAVYVGVARSALDAGRTSLRARGLDTLPAVRARLGRADANVAAAALVVREAAARVTARPGEPDTNRWVWRAKLIAGDTAAAVTSSVLEAAGAGATRRGHPLERLYRDARCGALQPATSDVCADWLGVAALGGNADNDTEAPRW